MFKTKSVSMHLLVLISSKESPTTGVNIGGVETEMLIDSGATSNIISKDTWEELKAQNIQCTFSAAPPKINRRNLFAYASDKLLLVKGTFTCEIKAGQRITQAELLE